MFFKIVTSRRLQRSLRFLTEFLLYWLLLLLLLLLLGNAYLVLLRHCSGYSVCTPVCRASCSLCGPSVAFGCSVTYTPWRSYTFAIVWLLVNIRSVWEYLVCLDAISYRITYYVRFV